MRRGGQDLSATFDTFNLVSHPYEALEGALVYLGLNYDLARGMQDELLRWAEEQRMIKRVRSREPEEQFLARSETETARPIGEERLEERRAS